MVEDEPRHEPRVLLVAEELHRGDDAHRLAARERLEHRLDAGEVELLRLELDVDRSAAKRLPEEIEVRRSQHEHAPEPGDGQEQRHEREDARARHPHRNEEQQEPGDDGLDHFAEGRVEQRLGLGPNVDVDRHPEELTGDALERVAEAAVGAFGTSASARSRRDHQRARPERDEELQDQERRNDAEPPQEPSREEELDGEREHVERRVRAREEDAELFMRDARGGDRLEEVVGDEERRGAERGEDGELPEVRDLAEERDEAAGRGRRALLGRDADPRITRRQEGDEDRGREEQPGAVDEERLDRDPRERGRGGRRADDRAEDAAARDRTEEPLALHHREELAGVHQEHEHRAWRR